jgi:hypothetical protein
MSASYNPDTSYLDVGKIVRINGLDGPNMAIVETDRDNQIATCVWFTTDGMGQIAAMPFRILITAI